MVVTKSTGDCYRPVQLLTYLNLPLRQCSFLCGCAYYIETKSYGLIGEGPALRSIRQGGRL